MNTFSHPQLQAILAPGPCRTALNQESAAQELLTLLRQHQDHGIANSNNNVLLELIKLVIALTSEQAAQSQNHLSKPVWQHPWIPTSHSVTPPPQPVSPIPSRQNAPNVEQVPPIGSGFPEGDMCSNTHSLGLLMKNLENNASPPTMPGLQMMFAGRHLNAHPHQTVSLVNQASGIAKTKSEGLTVDMSGLAGSAHSADLSHLTKSTVNQSAEPTHHQFNGSTQILLYSDLDELYLTQYQCLLRQQIELFEATSDELQASAQGRNAPIEASQVGIRCKHCAYQPIKRRSRGAVYFPRSIDGIYQVAQNLTKIHLCSSCKQVPENIRKKLTDLSKVNKRASGGKRYWIERVQEIGVYESGKALRFKKG